MESGFGKEIVGIYSHFLIFSIFKVKSSRLFEFE